MNILKRIKKMVSKDRIYLSFFINLDGLEWSTFNRLKKEVSKLCLNSGHRDFELPNPEWNKLRENGISSIGIYCTHTHYDIIEFPFKLESRIVIAESFHIKPLLMLKHFEPEVLMLHFHVKGSTLFKIQQNNDEVLDHFLTQSSIQDTPWYEDPNRSSIREYLTFLKESLVGSINEQTQRIIISGAKSSILGLKSFWNIPGLPVEVHNDLFDLKVPSKRFLIEKLNLQIELEDFFDHEIRKIRKENRILKNSSQHFGNLGNLIVNKKIKKLIVSLETFIFGKVCDKSGDILFHGNQMNHKDDDILDDLIELGLEHDVKVEVIPQKFLPEGVSYIYTI